MPIPTFAQSPAPNLTFQIAAGGAIGILTAVAIVWAYTNWQAQQALNELSENAARAMRTANAQARAQAEAQRAKTVADEEEAARLRLGAAAEQRAAEMAKQRQASEADARAAAWRRFYQQPARCTDNPTSPTLVECANEFIRSKRAFEANYKPASPP